jgi:hypothetical protein
VSSLRDTSFFPTPPDEDAAARTESIDHLNSMVGRWQGYLADGKFALAVDPKTPLGPKVGGALSASEVDQVARKAGFWTQPWPYWNMNLLVPEFWETLRDSGLVIFKVAFYTLYTIARFSATLIRFRVICSKKSQLCMLVRLHAVR